MIDTIVLDIGDVLVEYDWDSFMESQFQQEEIEVITECIWYKGEWEKLDRGVLSAETIRTNMVSYAPEYRKQIEWAFDHVCECIRMRPYAIKWIKELKYKGYEVYYLSNYSEHVKQGNPEALRFIPHLDGGIFSCEAKVIKPEKEIYQRFFEKYHKAPQRCVFIDDRKENVEEAIKCGMKGIVFRDYEQCLSDLNNILKAGVIERRIGIEVTQKE